MQFTPTHRIVAQLDPALPVVVASDFSMPFGPLTGQGLAALARELFSAGFAARFIHDRATRSSVGNPEPRTPDSFEIHPNADVDDALARLHRSMSAREPCLDSSMSMLDLLAHARNQAAAASGQPLWARANILLLGAREEWTPIAQRLSLPQGAEAGSPWLAALDQGFCQFLADSPAPVLMAPLDLDGVLDWSWKFCATFSPPGVIKVDAEIFTTYAFIQETALIAERREIARATPMAAQAAKPPRI